MFSVWYSLSEANQENGCIFLLIINFPGIHWTLKLLLLPLSWHKLPHCLWFIWQELLQAIGHTFYGLVMTNDSLDSNGLLNCLQLLIQNEFAHPSTLAWSSSCQVSDINLATIHSNFRLSWRNLFEITFKHCQFSTWEYIKRFKIRSALEQLIQSFHWSCVQCRNWK